MDGIASYITGSEYLSPGKHSKCYQVMKEMKANMKKDPLLKGGTQRPPSGESADHASDTDPLQAESADPPSAADPPPPPQTQARWDSKRALLLPS